MAPADVPGAVALHQRGLANELVARLGTRTLGHYHRAYLSSPAGLALVARSEVPGEVLGFLLGAVDPPAHYRYVVSSTGSRLALATAMHAATHPPLAWELLRTRALRWARGVLRIVARRTATGHTTTGTTTGRTTTGRPTTGTATEGVAAPAGATSAAAEPRTSSTSSPEQVPTAEVTHVVVDERQRGRGIGRALLEAAVHQAAAGGAARAELVTPLDDEAAAAFYEACGWQRDGAVSSRSGERFVRFVIDLAPPPDGRQAADAPNGSRP